MQSEVAQLTHYVFAQTVEFMIVAAILIVYVMVQIRSLRVLVMQVQVQLSAPHIRKDMRLQSFYIFENFGVLNIINSTII